MKSTWHIFKRRPCNFFSWASSFFSRPWSEVCICKPKIKALWTSLKSLYKKISTRKFLFFDLTNITLFARPLWQGAERVSLRVMSGWCWTPTSPENVVFIEIFTNYKTLVLKNRPFFAVLNQIWTSIGKKWNEKNAKVTLNCTAPRKVDTKKFYLRCYFWM